MGKVKDAATDWLIEYGYKLGYDWDNLPSISKMKELKTKRIYRRTYGKRKNSEDIK